MAIYSYSPFGFDGALVTLQKNMAGLDEDDLTSTEFG